MFHYSKKVCFQDACLFSSAPCEENYKDSFVMFDILVYLSAAAA